MLIGLLPLTAINALADELAEALTVADEYISVSVSKKNGGFTVKTVEGDRLKKSDNNKDLLYHNGEYDTSFLSFRVGEGEGAKDYIFGGKYAGSTPVSVEKAVTGDSITAVWSVNSLTFTQTISLANKQSNESGMASISVSVKNESGNVVPVQARLLLDTYLGAIDYGFYQYMDKDHNPVTVTQERVIEGEENIPVQIYASDDPYSASVTAYTVHTGEKPKKIAIGHWSRLASTLFDFSPSENLDFTEKSNEYYTSDSAYALYYDLGSVAAGAEAGLNTFYGVYSNYSTPAEAKVAVNLTAPVRLELNSDKTGFVKQPDAIGDADFSIAVNFTNISTETATDLTNISLAITSTANIRSLNDKGEADGGQPYDATEPYTFVYSGIAVGETKTKNLYFQAKLADEAHYERITVGVYDTSQTSGKISSSYKLGERTAYVLLPGSDNGLPKVTFPAMTPKTVYSEGTRHLFVTVTNESMLDNRGNWKLKAYSENGNKGIEIPETNINIKDGIMDVALTEDMVLAAGGWYLQLEWDSAVVGEGGNALVPAKYAKQSAPELHFTISNDKKYKNDSYGVLAVVEFEGYSMSPEKRSYRILSFTDEKAFEDYKADKANNGYTEIIFTFKGEFTATKKLNNGTADGVGTYYTAISTKTINDGVAEVDNPIVINDCLEFEDGTLTVYYENYESSSALTSAVCTEFDGKLYTQGARTDVWSGRAVFTKLEQYKYDYSLVPYDENGERISLISDGNGGFKKGEEEGFKDKPIYLIWPNVGGAIGQTISGLLFKLTYGQMGIMYDTDGYDRIEDPQGTVVSFAAALDLSFVSKQNDGTPPDTYWGKIQELWRIYNDKESPYKYIDDLDRVMQAKDWKSIDESGKNSKDKEVTASVMVRDVLFGCGNGFVGVNFSVGVSLKNYVSGLPEIEGTISVNTVNNWAYGVDGKIDLDVFALEAEVSIRSHNNIPVPDNFVVHVSGIEPGFNLDGMGVCWITGGGGGIKNLYDSIFSTKKVPPLKLLLSVSFEILKVLECEKATLSVGLTGVSVSAEDIGVKAVPGFTAIKNMGLSLEWYPGIDLRANMVVDLLNGLIYGGGYIVLISPDYKDVFFEMFARAALGVPESIPIVGGMRIGSVDLGLNSDKIWGAVDVLFITLGVTYYWGASSVDFGSGSKTQPTFPDLLGYDDIPVGYDAETDRTLYVRFGTNTSIMATNLPDDGTLTLMNTTGASLKSDSANENHEFNLGTYAGTDAIMQIVFDAANEEDAISKAEGITITEKDGTGTMALKRYIHHKPVTEPATESEQAWNSTANANLTFDSDTNKATYAFTVTEQDKYNKTWKLKTPAGSDVIMYNVAKVPEVTSVSGSVSGSNISLTWEGDELAELDKISFYLCGSNDAEATDPGHRISVVSDSATLSAKSKTFAIPADVPTGEYYIRAVYSKSDEVNGVKFSETKVNVENTNTPGTAVISEAAPSGDLQIRLKVTDGGNTDGYLVTVYDSEGNATDFEQVSFEKAESGSTVIDTGGSYTAVNPETGETSSFGLTAGETYTVGVTPYKEVTSGEGKIAVRGAEVTTAAIEMPTPVTPAVSFSANKTAVLRVVSEMAPSGTSVAPVDVEKTVYSSKDITFTAVISEAATGTWVLDAGTKTAFTEQSSINISLSDLEDGEHTLTVEGEAADGDGFSAAYIFTVDTLPPQLILSSPVRGSFFTKDGKVNIEGITDDDALLTVLSGTNEILSGKTVTEAGGTIDPVSGVFSLTLPIYEPNSASEHILTVNASDDVGNVATSGEIPLSNGMLADIESVEVLANGNYYSGGNLPVPPTGLKDVKLSLAGVTKADTRVTLTGYNIGWNVITVEGNATLTDDGVFSADGGSQGVITGSFAVADSGYRTAALVFGAPSGHTVSVSGTVGGTVSGGGEYEPGSAVTLTATPSSGYKFDGWTVYGVTVADTSGATLSFTMPDQGNVIAEAAFSVASGAPAGGGGGAATLNFVSAKEGELVKVKLPASKSGEDYLPYYYGANNEKQFVPISVSDGKYVYFIAPKAGRYSFGANEAGFTDISGRWSEQSILFNARREILKGVGNGLFAPETPMDRAMVITVLYRLAGSPAVSGTNEYADVENGTWYSDAVLWGTASGIVNGYGNGYFGTTDVITREQLAAMIKRFIDYMGFEPEETAEDEPFGDSAAISDWAKDAVSFCRTRGFINGMGDGTFAPLGNTTREQCAAVIERMIKAVLKQ